MSCDIKMMFKLGIATTTNKNFLNALFVTIVSSWLDFLFPIMSAVVVQQPSCVRLFVTLQTAALQASLSLTIDQSLPKFKFIALEMLSSHLILWCPLLLLPSIFPSIRDFSNELSICIRWANYWSFNFSISASSEYSGWSPLRLIGLISMLSNRPSGVFSSTTVQRHQFFDILPSLWSISHNYTWPLGRP